MAEEHDFKRYPELTNAQLERMQFESPHEQITMNFDAKVVKVHDGDTIRLKTEFRDFDFPLRLLDIDAPEMNEGGREARDWLSGRILGKLVWVLIDYRNRVDKYGRLLGRVMQGGFDVGEEEMMRGLAVPFSRRRETELPNLDKLFSIKQWL